MADSDGTWWSRPCGGREVLVIALPLVISTGAWSLQLFVDRMFLMWHSADEMAAALPAGMLNWTLSCFPLGLAGYVNAFVAQYHGAQRPDRIGAATWQGLRIGFYTTPLFLATIPLAPLIFRAAGHDETVLWHEVIYFQVLAFGSGASVIGAAQDAFFTGRGVTRVVMIVTLASTALNGLLDYIMIFGKFGCPEMGIEGAAWATVIAMWFRVAVFAALMYQEPVRLAYQLAATRGLDLSLFRRLIKYGAPSGVQYLVEGGAFGLMTLWIGHYGKTAMAASTMAFNVNSIAFIPMFGIGIAASTLVGQQLTQGRPDLAARATWTAFWYALLYTFAFGVLYIGFPDVLLFLHSVGADPAEYQAVREVAVVLLRFVAAYCLFDAMNIVFAGAIKGAGDTWFVLKVAAVVSISGLTATWLGADRGLLWWWLIVTLWVSSQGVIFLLRFLSGRWRTMRVIEDDLLAEAVESA